MFWNNSNSGTWATAANWSTLATPTATDNVFIEAGNATVTHSGSSDTVANLTTFNPLVLSGGGTLTVTSGMTLENTIYIGDSSTYGVLTFSGSETVTGSGSIDFGSNPANQLSVESGTPFFMGPSHGENGALAAANSGTFDNYITLAADVNDGTLTVNLPSTSWANYGLAEALNGGTLNLTSAWTNAGTISHDSLSTINLGQESFSSSTMTLNVTVNGTTPTVDLSGAQVPLSVTIDTGASTSPVTVIGDPVFNTFIETGPASAPVTIEGWWAGQPKQFHHRLRLQHYPGQQRRLQHAQCRRRGCARQRRFQDRNVPNRRHDQSDPGRRRDPVCLSGPAVRSGHRLPGGPERPAQLG